MDFNYHIPSSSKELSITFVISSPSSLIGTPSLFESYRKVQQGSARMLVSYAGWHYEMHVAAEESSTAFCPISPPCYEDGLMYYTVSHLEVRTHSGWRSVGKLPISAIESNLGIPAKFGKVTKQLFDKGYQAGPLRKLGKYNERPKFCYKIASMKVIFDVPTPIEAALAF